MKLQRFLTVAFVAVLTLGLFGQNKASAAGTYSISCKNDAYGMQLGSDYTDVAYVYVTGGGVSSTNTTEQYLIGGANSAHNEAYVGNRNGTMSRGAWRMVFAVCCGRISISEQIGGALIPATNLITVAGHVYVFQVVCTVFYPVAMLCYPKEKDNCLW